MSKLYSNEVVLDSFIGSGSVEVACVNTNRKFIGIELDEKYFDMVKQRIEVCERENRNEQRLDRG